MKIYVDADACPVVRIVEKLAKKYELPCTLLCDTNHVMNSDYSDVIVVGAGADAVDSSLSAPPASALTADSTESTHISKIIVILP